jgi:hypothetical protein
MDTTDNQKKQDWPYQMNESSFLSRLIGGLFITSIGAVLLAKQMGAEIPSWLMTWEILLIMYGIYSLAKFSFKKLFPGVMLILIGSVFLTNNFNPDLDIARYFWPMLLIAGGIWFMLKPRKRHYYNGGPGGKKYKRWQEKWQNAETVNATYSTNAGGTYNTADSDQFINSTTIMGGTKKTYFTKDFKGGVSTTILGGTDIDLSQADIQGTVVLELNQFLGGTKLVIPSSWHIKSDMINIMGGLEDKRKFNVGTVTEGESKVLLIKGIALLGGIDIKSY